MAEQMKEEKKQLQILTKDGITVMHPPGLKLPQTLREEITMPLTEIQEITQIALML